MAVDTDIPLKERVIEAPTNDTEAAGLLGLVGLLQAAMADVTAQEAADVTAVKTQASAERAALQALINQAGPLLQEWGLANLSRMTRGRSKLIRFDTGTISFRDLPAQLIVTDAKALMKWIRRHRMARRFIRVRRTFELRKKALKDAMRELIGAPGTRIVEGFQQCYLEPDGGKKFGVIKLENEDEASEGGDKAKA